MTFSPSPHFLLSLLSGTFPIIADISIIKQGTNVRNVKIQLSCTFFLWKYHYSSRGCSFSLRKGTINTYFFPCSPISLDHVQKNAYFFPLSWNTGTISLPVPSTQSLIPLRNH